MSKVSTLNFGQLKHKQQQCKDNTSVANASPLGTIKSFVPAHDCNFASKNIQKQKNSAQKNTVCENHTNTKSASIKCSAHPEKNAGGRTIGQALAQNKFCKINLQELKKNHPHFWKNLYLQAFKRDYDDFIAFLNTTKASSDGKAYNGEPGIISLTTWKQRISVVSMTLYNLLAQCPGFHIVLVLSSDEFKKRNAELPKELKLFIKNGLIEILWVRKNYKAYKKVIFTMNKYRDIPVISADDDCIYLYNYAKAFYNKWRQNPNSFVSSWRHKQWRHTAGCATLYPPYAFGNAGVKCLSDAIMKYTNQDDGYYQVLKDMLHLQKYEIVGKPDNTYIFHSSEVHALHNVASTPLNDLYNFLKNHIVAGNKRVIVSMYTTPESQSTVYEKIRAILYRQTLEPDIIHVWCEFDFSDNGGFDRTKVILHRAEQWRSKNDSLLVLQSCNTHDFVFFMNADFNYDDVILEYVFRSGVSNPSCIIQYGRSSKHVYNGSSFDIGAGAKVLDMNVMIPGEVYIKIINGSGAIAFDYPKLAFLQIGSTIQNQKIVDLGFNVQEEAHGSLIQSLADVLEQYPAIARKYVRATQIESCNYTLISNTCVGARFYEYEKKKFPNPFMWNSIKLSNFAKLVANFDDIDMTARKWIFTTGEMHKDSVDQRCATLVLDGLIKIYFIHHHYGGGNVKKVSRGYPGEYDMKGENILEYLEQKWQARLDRMRDTYPIFIYSDVSGYVDCSLDELVKLDVKYPVIIISKTDYSARCGEMFRCITTSETNTKVLAKMVKEFISKHPDFIKQYKL